MALEPWHTPPNSPASLEAYFAQRLVALEKRAQALEATVNEGKYAGVYYRGASFTLSTGWNKIPMDTTVTGTAFLESGEYKAPLAGLYQVSGVIAINAGASKELITAISKNAGEAEIMRGARLVTGGNPNLYNLVVTGCVSLAAGDKIGLYGYTSGGAETLEINAVENRLSVFRVT